jgi:hypothetical protein
VLPTEVPGLLRACGAVSTCRAMHDRRRAVACAVAGLSELELVDLLSLCEDVLSDVLQYHQPPQRRLPPLVFVRLRDAFGDYLVERGHLGAVVLAFYHRQ